MPHTHDRLCLTVETFIVHDGRVLLRMHDKYRTWLSVGGHIEPGEDPDEAAIREVREEVGLDVKLFGDVPNYPMREKQFRDLVPPRYLNRHTVSASHEHATFVFFATAETDRVRPGDTDDRSGEWKWFARNDLDNPASDLRDNIRFYAKAALDAFKSQGVTP